MRDIRIGPAGPGDLAQVAALELRVEPDCPASLQIIRGRFAMFPQGFLVARGPGGVLGYAESCIWNEENPVFGPEADFFRGRHDLRGRILYIIFLGVSPDCRRQGVGSMLIQGLVELAGTRGLERVQAATWDYLAPLYEAQGFVQIGGLDGFLPGKRVVHVERFVK